MNPALPKKIRNVLLRKSGVNRLPSWLRQEIPDDTVLEKIELLSAAEVSTVCQQAQCPNLSYCFKHLKFTFIILGDACTRKCGFCAVGKSRHKKAMRLDANEPLRIAEVVKKLKLNYVVITSVTRDDLKDGGAKIFSQTIELIRSINKSIKIEVLIPDFKGNTVSLKCVLNSSPNVVAHNIETIERLHPDLRPRANYRISLSILKKIKELKPELTTKSSIMLGLGETEEEVIHALEDLRYNHCDILTLGQYLSPSPKHYPVKEFINIEQFQRYKDIGMALGFKAVLSGPLVRSSYQAEQVYREAK